MLRTVSVHLIAMAVMVGTTAFVIGLLGEKLPVLERRLVIGVTAVYLAGWLALVSYRLLPRVRDRDPLDWRRHDRAVMWAGNVVTAICFWLQMPYADEALRLMVVIFLFGPVTVEVLGSIERPPARSRMAMAPLFLPVSTAVYYVVHWERFSVAVVLFSLAYGAVVMVLRGIIQGAVDRTYEARRAAEAARDAKTRFLTAASHDLRQPLQAAQLFFDQVLRGPDAAARERAARRVAWAFDATEQLLNQMLDHLKLEAGAVEPRVGRVALGALLARMAEVNEPAARLAGVQILALPTRLEALADEGLTERAVGNLVANSIRHAKARRLLLGARRREGRVRLWVIDDGVGISEADAPRLFEDYVQGSDHGDEIRGGFGLGLASARRMAELMQGGVGLDRGWAKGSAFWLELPALPKTTG